MLAPDQQDFYSRWTAKAAAIDPTDIAEHIDKYVTLFIIYNSLYNAIPSKLAASGHAGIPSGDKNGATTNVTTFLGAANILTLLAAAGHNKDIDELIEVLHVKMFNIKITQTGNPVPAEDTSLETGLRSVNAATKADALLKVLYYVRCNIFHGRKDLQPYQEILVSPLINILSTLNAGLYTALLHYLH
jgi:hypothetical protein